MVDLIELSLKKAQAQSTSTKKGSSGVLTLHFQVSLGLEVFDCGVIHDANHRHAVVLFVDGEREAAGYRVHPVVSQLDFGLSCTGDRKDFVFFKKMVK